MLPWEYVSRWVPSYSVSSLLPWDFLPKGMSSYTLS